MPGLEALRRMGFTDVAPLARVPWASAAPRSALDAALPGLADRLEPVGCYRLAGRWHLAYRLGTRWLGGGPPARRPAVSEEWAPLGWRVPRSYARLLAVHDGLGPIDGPRAHWWRDALLPAADLHPVSRRMRFGEEDILYRPADLLIFCPDGAGGGQCFDRTEGPPADPPTRSWRARDRALGPLEPYEAFARALVARWTGDAP